MDDLFSTSCYDLASCHCDPIADPPQVPDDPTEPAEAHAFLQEQAVKRLQEAFAGLLMAADPLTRMLGVSSRAVDLREVMTGRPLGDTIAEVRELRGEIER